MFKVFVLIASVVVIVTVVLLLLRKHAERSSPSPSPSTDKIKSPQNTESPGKKQNWLEGVGGEVKGKTYHIGQRAVTVGRAPTNFVQIMDTAVSRFHVRLTPVGQGLELQDMNSSIGTKVNQKPVNKATLKHGDTFSIGDAVFVFHLEAEFAVNEGLVGRKAVGGNSIKPTMMEEDGSMLDQIVMNALDEYKGDAIKVAQVTKLSVDAVERIRKKYEQSS